MKEPTYQQAFAVLCLQAADEGRGQALFGDCMERMRKASAPFFVGTEFPEVYLEFPLAGKPFIDITLLLGELEPGTRIDSPLAEGTEEALEFYSRARAEFNDLSCGFELDCKEELVPAAGIHFQPRAHRGLVQPFCEALGEPERAELYLAQDARMPDGWRLSFFGMFRGRPESPLRVCGYFSGPERGRCVENPQRIGQALGKAGFSAYDSAMLEQAAYVLAHAPAGADFQLDVWPDGRLGSTFGIDLHFESMQAPDIQRYLTKGVGAELVAWLVSHGVADERAQLLNSISLTRGIPVELDDGTYRGYGFSLVPGWLKVRWRDGALSESKMYLKASAGFVKKDADA